MCLTPELGTGLHLQVVNWAANLLNGPPKWIMMILNCHGWALNYVSAGLMVRDGI
jgi:hypothetical protein